MATFDRKIKRMFKKVLFLSILAVLPFAGANAQKLQAEIVFDTLFHDFGNLKRSESYRFDFVYTNRGEAPLVILGTKVSCTCTKVKWSRKPLLPGETAAIQVTYNSKDKGVFMKEITVTTNARNNTVHLTIKGKTE